MTPSRAPDDFREQMSAWHDGALAPEAARFVVRRVLADAALGDELARWQLAGDVLRRHAVARPAADVPARVAIAIDREPPAAQRPVARAPRWMAAAALVVGLGGGWVAFAPDGASPAADRVADAVGPAAPSIAASAARAEAPVVMPPRVIVPPQAVAHAVPELVRAPQPTPEQLAPLPSVDAPSRPWPRGAAQDPFVVDYQPPRSGR